MVCIDKLWPWKHFKHNDHQHFHQGPSKQTNKQSNIGMQKTKTKDKNSAQQQHQNQPQPQTLNSECAAICEGIQ